jgi:hypothetical protein
MENNDLDCLQPACALTIGSSVAGSRELPIRVQATHCLALKRILHFSFSIHGKGVKG